MHHLIKKQVLELTLVTEHDMFSMQQQAGQYYYSHILPAIERSLDALAGADHIIQIDKLEIDLGVIDWKEQAMCMNQDELNQVIESETRKVVERLYDQNYPGIRYNGHVQAINKKASLHAGEQWLFYMRLGYLPWNLTCIDDAWRMQVLEAFATDYTLITELKSLIKNDAHALTRLVHDHTVSFLVQLVGILTAMPQSSLPQQLQQLQASLYPGNKELQSTNEPPAAHIGLLWQQVLKGITGGATVAETISILEESMQATGDRKDKMKKDKDATDKKKDSEWKGGEIFVQHAGLILLHPFYKSLFTHTGLMENGQFISGGIDTAVWLLHYIATGKTTAEEHELVVPKVLCGFSLEQSPAIDTLPAAAELEEVNGMMDAAISQWNILKNTSADGLREGFLQRSGKVYHANGNLCFAIEPHAIDVLLDLLPWNISLVKLPWIKELITVEWR